MKTGYTISIITLTRNRARLLYECLSSLVGQCDHNDEIIVIDNASTDETQRVIKKFRSTLPIRSYVSHAKGFPKLYNFAISKAKGDLIMFFDDDCVAGRDCIRAHKRAHDQGPAHIVQGQTHSLPKKNIYAEIMGDHYQNWLRINMIDSASSQPLLWTFDNKNSSLPRSLIKKYGGFSLRFPNGCEDIELGVRLRKHGVPIVLDRRIVAYHHERTTLGGFVAQHLRFARTDAQFDRTMPREDKLGIVNAHKILLHANAAAKRELYYLTHDRLLDAMRLPLIYLLLFFVRIWGYATA